MGSKAKEWRDKVKEKKPYTQPNTQLKKVNMACALSYSILSNSFIQAAVARDSSATTCPGSYFAYNLSYRKTNKSFKLTLSQLYNPSALIKHLHASDFLTGCSDYQEVIIHYTLWVLNGSGA